MSVNMVPFNLTGGTLVAGAANTPGAKYRYTAISGQLDVLVEFVSYTETGNNPSRYTMSVADDETSGLANNFQPNIAVTGGTGATNGNDLLETVWKFSFSAPSTGTTIIPMTIPVVATVLDNDGGVANGATIREEVEFTTPAYAYKLSSTTNQTQTGDVFLGPAVNQAGIGTSPDYAVYAFYPYASSIIWKSRHKITVASGQTPAGNRLSSIGFTCFSPGFNFNLTDSDGDGLADISDIDDDNDGITDIAESGGTYDPMGDADGDNVLNYLDATPGTGLPAFTDANSDGINDFYDKDRDGKINSVDLDSDNDGIPDVVESGGVDVNGDGRIDGFTDTDNDGLAQTVDGNNTGDTGSGTGLGAVDFDGDGIASFLDLDSDNDGIVDLREAGAPDTDNNGIIDGYTDTDGDGFAQSVDGDTNNDGVPDNTAAALVVTGNDANSDGKADSYPQAKNNIDGQGKPNFLDIDADDDGIVDNIEAQSTAGYTAPASGDTDADGILNAYDAYSGFGGQGLVPVNTDADALADYWDLDSDNDGYSDRIEGHDTDGDNRADAGSNANNGVPGGTTDADGDGLLDGYDNNTASPVATNGTTNAFSASSSYPNVDGGTQERDWREAANTDGNGPNNLTDVDDDNDGITDLAEYGGIDAYGDADNDGIINYLDATPGTGLPAFVDANGDGINDAYDADGDGILNSLDLDSDNDGIADVVEAGGVDTNGDGVVDSTTDTDGDGLMNPYDTDNGGVNIAALDTDGDGIKNAYDLDSDGDGIPDAVEAGGTDANNDGLLDGITDADGDGFAQSVDGDANNDGTAENTAGALIITGMDGNADGKPDTYPRANTDRTGLPNPYDLDADGDGILDAREAGITDSDNNGVADGTLGSDGWSDTVDALASLSLPNSDGRGPANYLDIDADDDGITDNVEAQTTAAYQMPAGSDADGDGIDDNYDNNDAAFAGNASNGLVPNNHDGVDNPDYTDTDSDNDGVSDLKEGTGVISTTLTNTTDTDGDGLVDQFDTFNLQVQTSNLQNNGTLTGIGNSGSSSGPSPAGSNVIAKKTYAGATNRDWRNTSYVLPVRLLAFGVESRAADALLMWRTADELALREYTVERSTDGVNFTAVATVVAKGGAANDYSYADDIGRLATTKVYYRLQQTDNDGKFTYSGVVSLALSKAARLTLSVSPNPVKTALAVTITSDVRSGGILRIADYAGKIVLAKAITVDAGTATIKLEGEKQLPNGIYVLSLALNGETKTQRFVVQR